MLDKVPEVLVSTLIAVALLFLTVGIDSPSDALASCETSYFIAPSKPFSSEMIDVRKNPGMCERPNVLGENRVMDGDSYEIIEDAIESAPNELDRAVFSTAGTAAAVGSVCAQYERCLREKADIKMTLLGAITRVGLWSILAGIAIALMRRSGKQTVWGRATPLIIAFAVIAVFSILDYWGEPNYGTLFGFFMLPGAAFFGLMAVIAAEESQDRFASPSDKEVARLEEATTRAHQVSAALINSAGSMSPNLARGMTVGCATTIDALGYSKDLSELNTSAVRKWAAEFSRLLAEKDIDVDAKKAESVIRKGMVKAAGGREMMNLEVLTLGQLSSAVLELLKFKQLAHIGVMDDTEYRLPMAAIVRLRIDSDESFELMKSTSRLYADSVAEQKALYGLIEGDRLIVATKKYQVVGVAEATGRSDILRDKDKDTLKATLGNGARDFDGYCDVRWVVACSSLAEALEIGRFSDELGCQKSPRRTMTDVSWDGVGPVISQLEALTKPESGDISG